jgi:hypothetical protein
MSQENVEVVRQMLQAFADGGLGERSPLGALIGGVAESVSAVEQWRIRTI